MKWLVVASSAALALASSASAAPALDTASIQNELWRRASPMITSDLNSATAKSWDYIIIGCGLTGLTVANRLSEDASKSVLCIEAGQDTRNNDKVVGLGNYGAAFGDANLNWAYETTYQDLTGGTKVVNAGKGLGGSTSINGAAVTRASRAQYDAIGQLAGAPSGQFNADDLFANMKKSERFVPPAQAQSNVGARFVADAHGTSGPVQIAFTSTMYSGPQQPAFVKSVGDVLGVQHVDDLSSGVGVGVAYTPNTILANSGEARTRVSAATSYVSPIENSRPNLKILVGQTAIRMSWATGVNPPKASGVWVQSARDGPSTRIAAAKEVIVAAGSIATPALLERSGVGARSVTSSIGASFRLDLPGVGLNLIEQTMSSMGAPPKSNFIGSGPSNAIAYYTLGQVFANSSDVRNYVNSNLQAWAQATVDGGAATSTSALLKAWNKALDGLFAGTWPVAEVFSDSGFPAGTFGMDTWIMNPFSRGYVHARSMSPFDKPTVNPRYFTVPFDMDMAVQTLRANRRVYQGEAMKAVVNAESIPGFDANNGGIPDGTNHGLYSRWRNWILRGGNGSSGFSSVAHPIGTAAMLPQADGGVVGTDFKVYGTQNVRVVDASVLTVQTGHLSTTLYGIAEKAAATIKGA